MRRWHWQRLGRGSGRAWWGRWRVEWDWFSRHCTTGISTKDMEPGITLELGFFFLVQLWITCEASWAQWIGRKAGDHEYGISLFRPDWSLTLSYGCDQFRNSRGGYKFWLLPDVIFGKPVYTKRSLGPAQIVKIPLPEGVYPAALELTECQWQRPRWPIPTVVRRAEIEIPKGGLPVPGKGENSWDQGDDAIFSSTFPADTVAGAIGHIVTDVLETRERYSHLGWRPAERVEP